MNPVINMNSNKELHLSFELHVQDLLRRDSKNFAPTFKQAVQYRNT